MIIIAEDGNLIFAPREDADFLAKPDMHAILTLEILVRARQRAQNRESMICLQMCRTLKQAVRMRAKKTKPVRRGGHVVLLAPLLPAPLCLAASDPILFQTEITIQLACNHSPSTLP